jgi:hypothetical protein
MERKNDDGTIKSSEFSKYQSKQGELPALEESDVSSLTCSPNLPPPERLPAGSTLAGGASRRQASSLAGESPVSELKYHSVWTYCLFLSSLSKMHHRFLILNPSSNDQSLFAEVNPCVFNKL